MAEQSIELLDEKNAAFGIHFPHSSNVAQVIALSDETGQGRLVDCGRVLVDGGAELRHRIGQRPRDEQVSQTQRGIKNFAHGSGVDYATGAIQTLETRKRRTAEPKLGVVIVLQNVSAAFAREFEHCSSSSQAHRDPKRKL